VSSGCASVPTNRGAPPDPYPYTTVKTTTNLKQAVIFCNRKPTAEWLARRLSAAGYPSASLSSDLPQPERMAAVHALRMFKLRIIVATDVMARGVDLERVNLVGLLDVPPDAATYVHRVGRTGRFGTRGVAVAFVTEGELEQLQGLLVEARCGGESVESAAGGEGGVFQRW